MRGVTGAAWFAAGVLAVFACDAALDVYLLGHIARVKGAQATLIVYAWLAPVVALPAAIAYGIGMRAWRYAPASVPSFVAGAFIAALFWPLGWAGRYLPEPYAGAGTWIVILAASFFAARILHARSAGAHRRGAPAQARVRH